jgi:hypothetical protein
MLLTKFVARSGVHAVKRDDGVVFSLITRIAASTVPVGGDNQAFALFSLFSGDH